jgi:phosphoribosylaminoimidazole-succinocarboxamide synthase
MSVFWYDVLDFIPNHFITARFEAFPSVLHPFEAQLSGRSMLVRKAKPLPVECVARGYIAGSGWKEYQVAGTVGGHEVPADLQQSAKLPNTLFTPSTKAETGHDENITWKQCRAILGDELSTQVRDQTIDLYEHGCSHAAQAGILIADTKFEFGIADDRVILIDECLTPDSSRFWPSNSWVAGTNPPSFDKQFVRDYLETLNWDKTPPAPELPIDVAEQTSQKYIEAFEKLTGRKLPSF